MKMSAHESKNRTKNDIDKDDNRISTAKNMSSDGLCGNPTLVCSEGTPTSSQR